MPSQQIWFWCAVGILLYIQSPGGDARFAPGLVPEKCMQCLCDVETKCKAATCFGGDGPVTCGYFRISEAYYNACGGPGASWKECAADTFCASLCIHSYMEKYINNCISVNCLNFARLHHGGPAGCTNPNTMLYGRRVSQCSQS